MKKTDNYTRSILVVEDETPIAELCQRVLTSEGYEVDVAANGKVAQGMLEGNRYDILLVDIIMPTMTGKEFYRYLEDKYPQLVNRVIFMSGSLLGEDTKNFINQTGRPFLPKPFMPDELVTILQETVKEVIK